MDGKWHFEESELNDARPCVLRELQEELRLNYSFFADLKEAVIYGAKR